MVSMIYDMLYGLLTHYGGYQNAEINYWIPLTNVYGGNTLWLESRPGKGDFAPVILQVRS